VTPISIATPDTRRLDVWLAGPPNGDVLRHRCTSGKGHMTPAADSIPQILDELLAS
jgi:hypothetical protein